MDWKKLVGIAVVPFLLLVALQLFSGLLPQYYQLSGIYAWFWNGLLFIVIYLLIYVLTGYFVTKKFGKDEVFGLVFIISAAVAVWYVLATSIFGRGYAVPFGTIILSDLYSIVLFAVISLVINYPAALIGSSLAEHQQEKKGMRKGDNKMVLLLAIVCLVLAIVSSYYMFLGYFGCHTCEPPGLLESTSLLWGLIAYLLIFFVIKPHPIARAVIKLIAIITILLLFFGFGMLCPACPTQCTFQAGISCISSKLGTSGNLTLVIGQGTGHAIMITGVACSSNSTAGYMPTTVLYGGTNTNLTMASGSKATIAAPTTLQNVTCAGVPSTATVGGIYIGRLYINYTETDTGIKHIVTGSFIARYEVG